MRARLWTLAILAATGLALTPAAAQQVLLAQTPKTDKSQNQTYTEYEAQYRDKGWPKEVVEVFYTIRVDREAYNRVQTKYRHSDQRMIVAARDTKDLRLTGRQNLDDISNLTRDEVTALRRHAQGKGPKK